jgi:hypothetical protein
VCLAREGKDDGRDRFARGGLKGGRAGVLPVRCGGGSIDRGPSTDTGGSDATLDSGFAVTRPFCAAG